MKARCRICRKPISKDGLRASDGTLLDSPECLERHDQERELRALRNSLRVMRTRLKVRAIRRAEVVYRELGGQDWMRVRKLLETVL